MTFHYIVVINYIISNNYTVWVYTLSDAWKLVFEIMHIPIAIKSIETLQTRNPVQIFAHRSLSFIRDTYRKINSFLSTLVSTLSRRVSDILDRDWRTKKIDEYIYQEIWRFIWKTTIYVGRSIRTIRIWRQAGVRRCWGPRRPPPSDRDPRHRILGEERRCRARTASP